MKSFPMNVSAYLIVAYASLSLFSENNPFPCPSELFHFLRKVKSIVWN